MKLRKQAKRCNDAWWERNKETMGNRFVRRRQYGKRTMQRLSKLEFGTIESFRFIESPPLR